MIQLPVVVEVIVAVTPFLIVPGFGVASHHPEIRIAIPCYCGEWHVLFDRRQVHVYQMELVLLEEVVHQWTVPGIVADFHEQSVSASGG